jgi:hypothetical protein
LGDKSKGKKKRKVTPELVAFRKNYDDFVHANLKTLKYMEGTDLEYKDGTNLKYNLPHINKEYRDYLSPEDKQILNNLMNKRYTRMPFNDSTTVKEFLNSKKKLHTELRDTSIQIRNLYDRNSKNIKEQHLGGKNSLASKEFSKQLETYSNLCSNEYND